MRAAAREMTEGTDVIIARLKASIADAAKYQATDDWTAEILLSELRALLDRLDARDSEVATLRHCVAMATRGRRQSALLREIAEELLRVRNLERG